MPLKTCVVSGGRADFGLLLEPMRRLRDDPGFSLSVVMTGQHLVPGLSDCIAIAESERLQPVLVDMQLAGDDAVAVTRASGQGLIGFADVLQNLQPDLMILLGDRYEILCVALAATLARIPIVHIAGGDVTAGAMDDAFRHAITAMAHIHLVTNDTAARRVRQLGEAPARIHVVGSPGLDLMRTTPAMPRADFFGAIDFIARARNIVVTFHPVTREADSIDQVRELIAALEALGDAVGILITGANADPQGRSIDRSMHEFARRNANVKMVDSLGSELYVNALRHLDAVVGNSSSGLYEAPTFGIPTVNIGTRQDGRLRAASVIDCAPRCAAIGEAIATAFTRERRPVPNPYGDGHASERIVEVLKSIRDPRALLAKRFEDLPA